MEPGTAQGPHAGCRGAERGGAQPEWAVWRCTGFGFYLKCNAKPPERPSQSRPLGLQGSGSLAAPAKGGSNFLTIRDG